MSFAERYAVIFAPNSKDPRVIKRFRALQSLGADPLGACFRRARFNRKFQPDWEELDLGLVPDRRYLRRILVLLRAGLKLWGNRRKFRNARLFLAINLDLALLALMARRFAGSRAPLVYEVGDIQPLFLRKGLAGAVARWAERQVLRRSAVLAVTSDAFVRNYFKPIQGYDGLTFLLENKPLRAELGKAQGTLPKPRRTGRWRIGYFGALRCHKSWQLIRAIAAALPDRVEFVLRGYPTRIPQEEFERDVALLPNISYGGEYLAPRDLEEMYRDIDLVWAFELMFEDHNSRWLLPNRFYEGGYYQVPMLAASGFETGRLVEELGIGWTFDAPFDESLADFLGSLTPHDYSARRARFRQLPADRFASDRDLADLVALATGSAVPGGSGSVPAPVRP